MGAARTVAVVAAAAARAAEQQQRQPPPPPWRGSSEHHSPGGLAGPVAVGSADIELVVAVVAAGLVAAAAGNTV